ncbi:MAG: Lsr2 family protein [Actinomycetota bacterium]|nr:Lsr2 family protein [Actinomycetota bacterium]
MAQKVQVLLVCDLHGDETPGEETVAFSVDGAAYDIDVCSQHAGALRDAFAPFIGAARRSGGRASLGNGRRSSSRRGGVDRQKVAEIRSWAKGRGLPVSERGRIAGSVIAQYEAAH